MNMHAERKVPGGKLVRVVVSADDHITDVSLHGDFFLYPETAIDAIEESIIGAPVDTDASALVSRIDETLGPGVEFVGFGMQDVAELIREAIDSAE